MSGDIIGRAGTVAPEVFSKLSVLSRRHLGIEQHEGVWYVVALPEARNETYLNDVPMERGVAYPLTEIQTLRVDNLEFHLSAGEPDPDEPDPNETQLVGMQPLYDEEYVGFPLHELHFRRTHVGTETVWEPVDGQSVDHLPGAVVRTDLQLRVTATNAGARALLGWNAEGKDFDEWMTDRALIRGKLMSLEDGGTSGALETEFTLADKGTRTLELQASRTGDSIIISMRDVTARRAQTAELHGMTSRLARQSEILSKLSLSKAFQEGDVAKSFTLLAHQSAAALGCRRVSVWLKPSGAAGRKITCQVRYDTEGSAVTGAETDMDYCPAFFDQLKEESPLAEAEAGSPVMRLLQEIGFTLPDESNAALCAGLIHGGNFYGVLCFEKTDGAWTREDRQFALCLTSYGVLALQTREHRETLDRLRESEARMTAELEEASRYVQRILPDPITEGEVTAEWHMQPSEALSGDSFGYQWMGDDLFVMYILDVVGHGTGMALLSVSVLNNVRARLQAGEAAMADPAGVLKGLNAAFPMENQNNMLFSMWYGVYDRRTRMLTYSSAGHPPAILLHGEWPDDAEDYATLGTEGPSIGALDNVEFTNGQIRVERGSRLFLFTDGAFEIPVGGGREWTFEEFIAVTRSTRYMSGGEPAYLRKRIAGLCALPRFPDDFTIVRVAFEG